MNNKVAVVTGGSRGIGRKIVETLAQNEFDVVLNYLNSESSALDIKNNYSNVSIFRSDVSNPTEASSLIQYAIDTYGHIDLLVNNAGIDLIKTIDETTNDDFEKILKTNLFSAFYCSRDASKEMVKNKSGLIINISSIWGLTGASCEVAYSISKAGLDGLTKSLAKELGPSNIRVNSIAPGIINTDMNSNLSNDEENSIISEIPLGRIGDVSDVSDCVLYLYNSSYITGQVIQINGGWNI